MAVSDAFKNDGEVDSEADVNVEVDVEVDGDVEVEVGSVGDNDVDGSCSIYSIGSEEEEEEEEEAGDEVQYLTFYFTC